MQRYALFLNHANISHVFLHFFTNAVSECAVDSEHRQHSGNKRPCRRGLIAVGMSFGNHFVAYNIEHRASGHRQQKRKHDGRDVTDKVSGHNAYYLKNRHTESDDSRAAERYSGKQQRSDNHHPSGMFCSPMVRATA